jgi:ubiquinone biosynthesis protein Coq4
VFHDDPSLRRFIEEKWYPEPYSFDALGELPTGTFGREYHRHIVENNLNREIATGYRSFHQALEASGVLKNMPDEVKYAVLRGFQTHDLLHIVTGFDTTGPGEIALQAFCLAQVRSLYFATWMSVVTTRMAFLDPNMTEPLMDAISEGWTLARKLPNLMVVKWELMLDRPLAEVRREFGIPQHRMMKQAA